MIEPPIKLTKRLTRIDSLSHGSRAFRLEQLERPRSMHLAEIVKYSRMIVFLAHAHRPRISAAKGGNEACVPTRSERSRPIAILSQKRLCHTILAIVEKVERIAIDPNAALTCSSSMDLGNAAVAADRARSDSATTMRLSMGLLGDADAPGVDWLTAR